MFCLKGRFFLGGGDIREPRRDTLSRAYPATMESNKRARTTEAEALPMIKSNREMIQSLRDQMAKRETELATLRAELRRALSETREGVLQSTIASLRDGAITVFEVIAEQLPDVFAAEILSKLDLADTLNLAQVSKKYRDLVWSLEGARSFPAKVEAHFAKVNVLAGVSFDAPSYVNMTPLFWAARHGNLRAVRALLESGENPHEVI